MVGVSYSQNAISSLPTFNNYYRNSKPHTLYVSESLKDSFLKLRFRSGLTEDLTFFSNKLLIYFHSKSMSFQNHRDMFNFLVDLGIFINRCQNSGISYGRLSPIQDFRNDLIYVCNVSSHSPHSGIHVDLRESVKSAQTVSMIGSDYFNPFWEVHYRKSDEEKSHDVGITRPVWDLLKHLYSISDSRTTLDFQFQGADHLRTFTFQLLDYFTQICPFPSQSEFGKELNAVICRLSKILKSCTQNEAFKIVFKENCVRRLIF